MARALGIDFGEKRVGLALSDRLKLIASPYKTIDYVSENDLITFSQKENHNIGKTSIHYFFSHNANIPSIDLRQAETITEIKQIMKGYSHSLKYVFIKEHNGEEYFKDCISNPSDSLCLSH